MGVVIRRWLARRYPLLAVVPAVGLVGALAFLGGYLLFARRLPDYLASMTREELSMLARLVASKRPPAEVHAEAPRPTPFEDITRRQQHAEQHADAEARRLAEAERAG